MAWVAIYALLMPLLVGLIAHWQYLPNVIGQLPGQTAVAWVQAIGAIGAIGVAQYIASQDAKRAREELAHARAAEDRRIEVEEQSSKKFAIGVLFIVDAQLALFRKRLITAADKVAEGKTTQLAARAAIYDGSIEQVVRTLDILPMPNVRHQRATYILMVARQRCTSTFERLKKVADVGGRNEKFFRNSIAMLTQVRDRARVVVAQLGGSEDDLFKDTFVRLADFDE